MVVVPTFALTVSAMLAGVVSGVTFTAEFEKSLETQLAQLKQEIAAYPDFQPVVQGVPQDVVGWKALSLEETLAKLTLLSNQKANEMPFLYALDRDNTAKLTKFAEDSHDLVMQIAQFLESYEGDATPVAVQGGSGDSASAAATVTPPPASPSSSGASGATAATGTGGSSISTSSGASAASPVNAAASKTVTTTTATATTTAVASPASPSTASSPASLPGSTVSGMSKTSGVSSSSTSVASSSVASTANVAASVLSLQSTGLFAETNSTGSSSSDGSDATASHFSSGDVGAKDNNSANTLSDTSIPLPAPESSAVRNVLSAIVATTIAVAFAVVM